MPRRWTSWVALAALALIVATAAATPPASAAGKHAFVVGIDRYDQLPAERQLRNAVNDARAVGAALGRLGFQVSTAENVDRLDLARQWQSFLNRIQPGDVAAFFFAGHGVEIGGLNYLLPRDVPTVASGEEGVLRLASLPLSGFLDELRERNPRVALHIVDACRDNPFVDSRGRSVGASRGLARIEPPRGTFVMFSAGAGQSALDRLSAGDTEPNSVYTRTLLRHLVRPGAGLPDIARDVRAEVLRLAATARHEQTPSYYDEMIGRYCPAGCDAPGGAAGPASPPVVVDPCALAAAHWQGAVAVGTAEAFEDHLRRFPTCTFAGLAKAKIAALKQPQVAAVLPPVRPPAPSPVTPAVGLPPEPPSGMAPLTAAQERALQPKQAFKECDNCPEMVVIPAGSFTMGAPAKEEGWVENEGPQRRVTIARPFAVGRFEITRAQFAEFVRESGHNAGNRCWTFENGKGEQRSGRSWRSPGFSQTGDHPVVCVNWHDAKAYVAWLGRKTGRSYRLLTEAEREYSARAGTTTRFWFGNAEKDLCRHGNVLDRAARKGIAAHWTVTACSDGHAYTAPVGSYRPNAFGLHDMLGNVEEWVEDCWNASYRNAPTDGSAWATGECNRRVIRGGSWTHSPRVQRSASRGGNLTSIRGHFTGFRVARTLLSP